MKPDYLSDSTPPAVGPSPPLQCNREDRAARPSTTSQPQDLFSAPSTSQCASRETFVTLAEYERVVTNNRLLSYNIDTLKGLTLQLAAQLNDVQAELRLWKSSSTLPADPTSAAGSKLPPTCNSGYMMAQRTSVETADAERLKVAEIVIQQQEAMIQALQSQLRRHENESMAHQSFVLSRKNEVIEQLVLQIESLNASAAPSFQRRGV